MKCPHCGFEDEGNFCSNCGKPLVSKETSVSTKLEASIKLGFGKSSSANYGYVVELMQKQPTYSLGPNNVHIATFSADNIEEFFEIFEHVKNWKTSFVEINGKKFQSAKYALVYHVLEKGKKHLTLKNIALVIMPAIIIYIQQIL